MYQCTTKHFTVPVIIFSRETNQWKKLCTTGKKTKQESGIVLQSQLWFWQIYYSNIASVPPSDSLHWSFLSEMEPETVGNPALLLTADWPSSGELHVSRPSCQYVPEQPGDPLLFRVRLQPHQGAPPCSLGCSLLFWTKLPPNARFLDMDIKRILLERRGEECPGRKGRKKKKPPTQPPSALELAVSFQPVSPCATPS